MKMLQKCMEEKGKHVVLDDEKMRRFGGNKDENGGEESLKELMRRDLNFLKGEGVFEKFGIKIGS